MRLFYPPSTLTPLTYTQYNVMPSRTHSAARRVCSFVVSMVCKHSRSRSQRPSGPNHNSHLETKLSPVIVSPSKQGKKKHIFTISKKHQMHYWGKKLSHQHIFGSVALRPRLSNKHKWQIANFANYTNSVIEIVFRSLFDW
jgi:hypothetical protein